MLKKVIVNKRSIPVPVPVRTLEAALVWVGETLVGEGQTITRIVLDGTDLTEGWDRGDTPRREMRESSRLEIQIDTPADLAVQTLEALRSLASVIGAGLKQLAVDCWQTRPNARPAELDALVSDLRLIDELVEHLSGLIDAGHLDVAAIQGLAGMMRRVSTGLDMAVSNSDWKGCARILLNRLEPLLKDMIAESETLQIRVLTAGQSPGRDGAPATPPKTRAPTG